MPGRWVQVHKHRPADNAVTKAIAVIEESGWKPIRHPQAIFDEAQQQWVSGRSSRPAGAAPRPTPRAGLQSQDLFAVPVFSCPRQRPAPSLAPVTAARRSATRFASSSAGPDVSALPIPTATAPART